ncbi:hypothetical protein BT93_F2678 [Corymbia citriodora subsp. variegata]|nr:hypothetical protein BT93_F2678 [Corymbia citriodora subsp. variegata]
MKTREGECSTQSCGKPKMPRRRRRARGGYMSSGCDRRELLGTRETGSGSRRRRRRRRAGGHGGGIGSQLGMPSAGALGSNRERVVPEGDSRGGGDVPEGAGLSSGGGRWGSSEREREGGRVF